MYVWCYGDIDAFKWGYVHSYFPFFFFFGLNQFTHCEGPGRVARSYIYLYIFSQTPRVAPSTWPMNIYNLTYQTHIYILNIVVSIIYIYVVLASDSYSLTLHLPFLRACMFRIGFVMWLLLVILLMVVDVVLYVMWLNERCPSGWMRYIVSGGAGVRYFKGAFTLARSHHHNYLLFCILIDINVWRHIVYIYIYLFVCVCLIYV